MNMELIVGIAISGGVGLWWIAFRHFHKIWTLNNRKLPPGYISLSFGITLFCADVIVGGCSLYLVSTHRIPEKHSPFIGYGMGLCLAISYFLVFFLFR